MAVASGIGTPGPRIRERGGTPYAARQGEGEGGCHSDGCYFGPRDDTTAGETNDGRDVGGGWQELGFLERADGGLASS